jgi:hypothetical protein
VIFLSIFTTAVSAALAFSPHHFKILLFYLIINLKLFFKKKKKGVSDLGVASDLRVAARPPLGPGVAIEPPPVTGGVAQPP